MPKHECLLLVSGYSLVMTSRKPAAKNREKFMNELTTKVFQNINVRVLDESGTLKFVMKEVADALGYKLATNFSKLINDKYKGISEVNTLGGPQEMLTVTEPGLYQALARSQQPKAEPFQDWVFEEVLPSIRKTGKYGDFLQLPANINCEDLTLEANNVAVNGEYAIYRDRPRYRRTPSKASDALKANVTFYTTRELAKVNGVSRGLIEGLLLESGYGEWIQGKLIPTEWAIGVNIAGHLVKGNPELRNSHVGVWRKDVLG